ncbi:hypothetical protein M0R45_038185 [Rubus argutus]|uniref:Uncharacterized protein n=1 Tax=Rubus argutus TaxID=59490 RepID=A0AAW1W4Y6_RUBAR
MYGSRVHYENRVGQDGPTRQMGWATREICMGPLQPIAAVDSRPAISWRLSSLITRHVDGVGVPPSRGSNFDPISPTDSYG